MLVGAVCTEETRDAGRERSLLQGDQSCLDVSFGKSDVPQRYLLNE